MSKFSGDTGDWESELKRPRKPSLQNLKYQSKYLTPLYYSEVEESWRLKVIWTGFWRYQFFFFVTFFLSLENAL